MISFTETILEKLVVHQVGNNANNDVLTLSAKEYKFHDKSQKEILLRYFTTAFKTDEFYVFTHESDLSENAVYNCAAAIFDDRDEFHNQSVKLAKHLYEQSSNPKTKTGEFFVVFLRDCAIDGELLDAVGLFKSENKETFLKVAAVKNNFEIDYEDGININKIDLGCLIFNTSRDDGFNVAIVNNIKGDGTQQWRDDFLQIAPRNDNYHQTQNLLTFCKEFVTEELPNEMKDFSRADQADLLNKSLDFFKGNDAFSINDYEKEVIQKPKAIKAFREYKDLYEQEREVDLLEEFDISEQALKKQQRIFKSVIKLDKNFHIYVHGSRELIEKGYDASTGMHFYKVFFSEEN